MISPAGCFDYTVVVKRDGSVWRGWAKSAAPPSDHPGMVGGRPLFELASGLLTLRSTPSPVSPETSAHYEMWGPPAASVRLAIGPAVGATLDDGDVVQISRRATTDLAISVHNSAGFKIGLGALARAQLGTQIAVEEDPRAEETSLYDVVRSLDRPDATLVWVDVSDPNHEAVLRTIPSAPPGGLLIAIAGQDQNARRQMNRRVGGSRSLSQPGWSWSRYVDVDGRFKTRDEWLQYLRSLPKSRPDDLWLRISIGETHTTLTEGAYAFVDPWHLFVRKVYTPGLPGELSQLAIGRSHPALTQSALIESTNVLGSHAIDIEM